MFDHVSIGVADIGRTRKFYDAALKPLGYTLLSDGESSLGYGGKAVVLGRWVPIVRTFVPFVAGAGSMTYRTFAVYNVIGAVIWVGVCLGAGYLFGNVPIVKKNFTLVMLGIVFVSVLPAAYEFLKHRRAGK